MGEIEKLADEIRAEFQIPPFFPDTSLCSMIRESEIFFEMINPGCDPDLDLTYRELLKNRVYYAYHHALNNFHENYKFAITTWQAETKLYDNTEETL